MLNKCILLALGKSFRLGYSGLMLFTRDVNEEEYVIRI